MENAIETLLLLPVYTVSTVVPLGVPVAEKTDEPP